MKIVIDIPEEMWEKVKNGYVPLGISKYLKNSTPLPKEHGRLIDADMLKEYARVVEDKDLGRLHTVDVKDIDNAPTIIKADKEYKAEVITRGNCMMCGKELTEGLFICKECVDKANTRK